MYISTQVIALSDQGEEGLIFSGAVTANVGGGGSPRISLADAVLRELRGRGHALRRGDTLFFPNAAPGHRFGTVDTHASVVRAD